MRERNTSPNDKVFATLFFESRDFFKDIVPKNHSRLTTTRWRFFQLGGNHEFGKGADLICKRVRLFFRPWQVSRKNLWVVAPASIVSTVCRMPRRPEQSFR